MAVFTAVLENEIMAMDSNVVSDPVAVATVRNPPVVAPFPFQIDVLTPLSPPLIPPSLPHVTPPLPPPLPPMPLTLIAQPTSSSCLVIDKEDDVLV